MAALSFIVAGGGIGGLAVALVLARQGHAVQVLEQADALGEIGAGIQLGPNVFRMFEHLHRVALPRQHQRHGQTADTAASDDERQGDHRLRGVQRASHNDQRPPDSTARPSARNFNRCARSERAATGCMRSGTSL